MHDADFDAARLELDAAIAARKTLRDFGQQSVHRPGAPKSSLDGGRVSVLAGPASAGAEGYRLAAARFRIPGSEHLDAVGVVKRCGGDAEQFVPVANVALATWLAAARACPAEAGGTHVLDQLSEDAVARRFGTLDGKLAHAKLLAVDAQCCIESRLPALLEEAGIAEGEREQEARRFQENFIGPLRDAVGRTLGRGPVDPPRHVGVLVADGDRMGEAIGTAAAAGGAAMLRALSEALSGFAGDARAVVERHRGSTIYAGGDDVLAFVPLGTAVACAAELRETFRRCLSSVVPGLRPPTLSVGLGIGHYLHGMADLLDLGRAAERLAKGDGLVAAGRQRDALAIVLDKRGGTTRSWRCSWPASPVDAIDRATQRMRRRTGGARLIPTTKLYQVMQGVARMPPVTLVEPTDDAAWIDVLTQDVLRTLNRSDGRSKDRGPTGFGLPSPLGKTYAEARAALDEWLALHLIAKEILAATHDPALQDADGDLFDVEGDGDDADA